MAAATTATSSTTNEMDSVNAGIPTDAYTPDFGAMANAMEMAS